MIPGAVSSPLIWGGGERGQAGRTWEWAKSEDLARGLYGTLWGLKVDGGAMGHWAGGSRARKESRWALPGAPGGAGADRESRAGLQADGVSGSMSAPSGRCRLATHEGQDSGKAVGGGLWEELVQASQD